MLLADLGADVIQVDRPGGAAVLGSPPGVLDRGRRSVAIDLKDPRGAAAVRELSRHADVFVEGFRPGVAERLGVGPDDLMIDNPAVVYARMTGWGQAGAYSARAGHDINYIALAGALEPIGRGDTPPVPPLNLVGDFGGGGLLMAFGIMSALYERVRSGRGQVVDVAMVDGAALLTAQLHALRAAGLWKEQRASNLLDGGSAFYDCFETSDGRYVAVGAVEPHFFAEVLERLGLEGEDLPFHLDPAGWPELKARLSAVFATRSRDEWAEVFEGTDACVTPVLSPWEAPDHPANAEARRFVAVGGIVQPAPAPRFSRTPTSDPTPLDASGRDPLATLAAWDVDLAEQWVREGVVV